MLVRDADLPLRVAPGVVVWGSRTFVRDDVPPHQHSYVEAFAYVLPDGGAAPLPPEVPATPVAEECPPSTQASRIEVVQSPEGKAHDEKMRQSLSSIAFSGNFARDYLLALIVARLLGSPSASSSSACRSSSMSSACVRCSSVGVVSDLHLLLCNDCFCSSHLVAAAWEKRSKETPANV